MTDADIKKSKVTNVAIILLLELFSISPGNGDESTSFFKEIIELN
jgi:hypothetical protein